MFVFQGSVLVGTEEDEVEEDSEDGEDSEDAEDSVTGEDEEDSGEEEVRLCTHHVILAHQSIITF